MFKGSLSPNYALRRGIQRDCPLIVASGSAAQSTAITYHALGDLLAKIGVVPVDGPARAHHGVLLRQVMGATADIRACQCGDVVGVSVRSSLG